MMLAWAFFAWSPSPYMRMPQATAQYGQVLRVSLAWASLNSRTSASATDGENPISARLDPAREAPVTAKNRRRVMSTMKIPFWARRVCQQCTAPRAGHKATPRLRPPEFVPACGCLTRLLPNWRRVEDSGGSPTAGVPGAGFAGGKPLPLALLPFATLATP